MNLLEAMEEAVAERGENYKYPRNRPGWTEKNDGITCLYVSRPKNKSKAQPACIVGLALSKMGVSNEVLDYVGDTSELRGARGEQLPDLTEDEWDALSSAQFQQDLGQPWGVALDTFKASLA